MWTILFEKCAWRKSFFESNSTNSQRDELNRLAVQKFCHLKKWRLFAHFSYKTGQTHSHDIRILRRKQYLSFTLRVRGKVEPHDEVKILMPQVDGDHGDGKSYIRPIRIQTPTDRRTARNWNFKSAALFSPHIPNMGSCVWFSQMNETPLQISKWQKFLILKFGMASRVCL